MKTEDLPPTHLLAFYVPKDNADQVLEAIFKAGAGKIGNYDQCCWKTEGTGQFRPLEGSAPSLGKQGKVEFVQEWKVELVCRKEQISDLVEKLREAHPYEEPAYHLIPIST